MGASLLITQRLTQGSALAACTFALCGCFLIVNEADDGQGGGAGEPTQVPTTGGSTTASGTGGSGAGVPVCDLGTLGPVGQKDFPHQLDDVATVGKWIVYTYRDDLDPQAEGSIARWDIDNDPPEVTPLGLFDAPLRPLVIVDEDRALLHSDSLLLLAFHGWVVDGGVDTDIDMQRGVYDAVGSRLLARQQNDFYWWALTLPETPGGELIAMREEPPFASGLNDEDLQLTGNNLGWSLEQELVWCELPDCEDFKHSQALEVLSTFDIAIDDSRMFVVASENSDPDFIVGVDLASGDGQRVFEASEAVSDIAIVGDMVVFVSHDAGQDIVLTRCCAGGDLSDLEKGHCEHFEVDDTADNVIIELEPGPANGVTIHLLRPSQGNSHELLYYGWE